MIIAGDPVGAGLVSSLAHPGGNVTGLSNLSEGVLHRWVR
jgi:putative ABC transport system substrate-binding protein